MMRVLCDNGLTLALVAAFLLCLIGMTFSGWLEHNEQLSQHGNVPLDVLAYFFSSDFQSALFENWESEFLQMSAYVILTALLFQRGSAESKDPDSYNPEDADPAKKSRGPDAPWPVRKGGLIGWLYSYSPGSVLALMFVFSFVLHWLYSVAAAGEPALQHSEPTQAALEYLPSAQLWFVSFQNWQSEFMATAALVVLSIVLRHRGSPESKPVAAPHSETGA
jgi:uncharacterized protein DUF6766